MTEYLPAAAIVLAIIAGAVLVWDNRKSGRKLALNSAKRAADRLELMRLCQDGGNAFLRAIRDANPQRDIATMPRRIIKIGEEYGEASEAYLVASTQNKTRKVKTYDDLREELIDLSIVGLDCALTRMPGEDNMTDDDIEFRVMEVLSEKLAKWKRQKEAQIAITDELSKVDDAV